MKKISELSLPPHRFTYELYCGKVGFSISQILALDARYQTKGLRPGVTILGFTDASKIPVRQRPGEWAVMVEMPAVEYEDDGSGFTCWFHADERTLQGLGYSPE